VSIARHMEWSSHINCTRCIFEPFSL